jgi:dTDP-4-dehydrorhamnose reductase
MPSGADEASKRFIGAAPDSAQVKRPANSRLDLTRLKQVSGAENLTWNSAPRWDLIDGW